MRKHIILGVLIVVMLVFSATAATKIFRVQETDFVKVNVTALDPDYDAVSYAFSNPLDQDGEWQTDFGDAGEYIVDVIASDGKSNSTKKIKIIVETKNRAPIVKVKELNLKEGDTIDLRTTVEDLEGDVLTYGFPVGFVDGVLETSYEDAGEYVYEFTVSDGEFTINARVKVIVQEKNQPPIIKDIFNTKDRVDIEEGDEFRFFVDVTDNDGDDVNVIWKYDGKVIATESTGLYDITYDSAGNHELVLLVNDSFNTFEKKWTIVVENVNRKPELEDVTISVEEGETAEFLLPEVDQDGDTLTYTFEEPFNEEGKWETTYKDAGTYTVDVVADDGDKKTTFMATFTIENVDREPTIELESHYWVEEGGVLQIVFDAQDPDGDELDFTINNAPPGSILDGNVFTWNPTLSEVARRGGVVSDILASLRVEKYFLRQKRIPIKVEVCGLDLCDSAKSVIAVQNKNQIPHLDNLGKVIVNETDTLKLQPNGKDYDGDQLHYKYTKPLSKYFGTWKTDYEDEGNYTAYVTVSDGVDSATKPIDIIVLKNNRAPSINVDDSFIILEGETITFTVSSDDKDMDDVTILLENMPPGASFVDGTFTWTPPQDWVVNKSTSWISDVVSKTVPTTRKFSTEKKIHWLTFKALDGETETIHPVKLTVKNVNVAPKIKDFLPEQIIDGIVNEPLVFHAVATDADGDELWYKWMFDMGQGSVSGSDTIERTYVTTGKKKVVLTVTDGRDTVEKVWEVDVTGGITSGYVGSAAVPTVGLDEYKIIVVG
jgi:hypothetical protein